MKSYLALVPQYERVHRKSSRMSVLCIVFSVLLVTAIFSMADMALRAQKSYFIKTNGEYHASVTGISEETAELIGARLDVAVCGWTYQGSMGMIGSKTVSFAGASEDAFSILTEMELQSGTYPARPDEALLNQTALEQLGLSVGDTVTVALSDGRLKAYHVTGVLRDMGSLLKADVYGMVMNEDGFREIADENAIDGTTFRIQFKPGVNIRSAIREIRDTYGLSDRQVAENTALLGLMGQSENSTMQSLYIVAIFLILLVLIAGTVMIAASFNTNVLERVQFYGLLRCLGADKQFSDINDDTVVAATRNLLPADSTVSDKRLSNSEDRIPLMISERLIDVSQDYTGEFIMVSGQFRSYNRHDEQKNRLVLSVFVREVEFIEEELDGAKTNNIFLDGYICKLPVYRKTPLGREIADLLLAVNRPYGKSDYIPCICWGRNARFASTFEVGEHVQIIGRIQSREYIKKLTETETEKRVAYEVSVSKLECPEE